MHLKKYPYTPVPPFEYCIVESRGPQKAGVSTHDPKDIGLSAQAMKFPGSKTRPPTRLKRQVKFLSTWLGRDRVSYHSKINCILCIVKLPQRVGPRSSPVFNFYNKLHGVKFSGYTFAAYRSYMRIRKSVDKKEDTLLSSPPLSSGILDLRSHLVLLVLVLCHRPSCRLAGLPREVTAAARIGI